MCIQGSSRSVTPRSSTLRLRTTPVPRPFCSTSTRSEWSVAVAAKAVLRISTSTIDRTSRRRCSRLYFRAGSTPPWPVDASGNPTSRRPSCPWKHVLQLFPAAVRSIPSRVVRASRVYGRSDPPRTRREHADPRPGRALDLAESRLKLDRLAPKQRERIRLVHGSLVYRDSRLQGFDAAAVMEVIEHLDRPRLRAFERVVFESARPGTVAVTTPNAEYNVKWPSLSAGQSLQSNR
jgi:hypothetical protein